MRFTLIILVKLLLFSQAALATGQPDSFIGQPDNRYSELDCKVYYYHAVVMDFPAEDGTPAMPEDFDWLADLDAQGELVAQKGKAEWNDAIGQMDAGRLFYWRNSRFNCLINYEWEFSEEPILRSSIASEEAPYHSPVDHPAYGDDRLNYDGLFQIYRLFQYDAETGHMQRVPGGGGFTWGADAETGECGWSWYAAPPAGHYCGVDWLMVHEFGHQLDSLFEQSGHPELWFNHLAPELSNTARFGEHFDANSFILRRIREKDWENLKWGETQVFADNDKDGVPANGIYQIQSHDWFYAEKPDKAVDKAIDDIRQTDPFSGSFDLVSFNAPIADPYSFGYGIGQTYHLLPVIPVADYDDNNVDSDQDKVSDLDELLASNGIYYGHGEVLSTHGLLQDPSNPDTDGDGLWDGDDPYPTIANFDSVHAVDDNLESLIHCGPANAADSFSVQLQYTLESQLEIRLTTSLEEWNNGRRFKLMLDLDNNGWFVGSDNYRFLINRDGFEQAARNVCPESIEHPSEDREFLEADRFDGIELLSIDTESIPGRVLVILTVGCEQFHELGAVPGEMLGINAGIAPAGAKRFEMFMEPNTLLPVELRR
jgi:hypothetical protein